MNKILKVIGGGLAGCEAAWQAAERGIDVKLYDMKPLKKSGAHKSDDLCELVCSNSLKADAIDNACGLLKEEMRRLNSVVISCADATRVPAGGALAVDRDAFAKAVTERIKNHPNIEIISETVSDIDENEPTVVATGPLTDEALLSAITRVTGGEYLYFYDAASPIVETESIDFEKVYYAARYGKGEADYINCPMSREEYYAFYNELINAETAPLHEEVEKVEVFEGCMPVEVMAKRGEQTLCFGPLKPKGLPDPKTGREPYAVVQLRRDNAEGTMYNLVGFQTNLKFGEQKRVFSMIPGLENANFLRYGVMHRNTFIKSPGVLDACYGVKKYPNVYFAGQITGVEGYVESAASGLVAGMNAARQLLGEGEVVFPNTTCIGALADYVANYFGSDFQPMNANFGVIAPLERRIRDKKERYGIIARRSLAVIDKIAEEISK